MLPSRRQPTSKTGLSFTSVAVKEPKIYAISQPKFYAVSLSSQFFTGTNTHSTHGPTHHRLTSPATKLRLGFTIIVIAVMKISRWPQSRIALLIEISLGKSGAELRLILNPSKRQCQTRVVHRCDRQCGIVVPVLNQDDAECSHFNSLVFVMQ